MNKQQLMQVLRFWDKKNRHLFTKHELLKFFPCDSLKAFSESLNRMVKAGLLQRVCRGVYMNPNAMNTDQYTLEHIAKKLRLGEYNYVSLESALSEQGVISQIPIDRLTVMTTGREGIYETPFGVIEFTHTKRSAINILNSTLLINQKPLRAATQKTAWRDLKRVGRNTHLVDEKEIDNEN